MVLNSKGKIVNWANSLGWSHVECILLSKGGLK